MSGCVEFQSSMTGSTSEGPLQPPEDSAPLPAGATTSSSSSSTRSSYGDRHPLDNDEASIQSPSRQQARLRQKMMTPVRPPSGQPIQLTPLWEHVVRTQRFPSEVDTRETFDEISERLRDPEWEVRQHALRVLVDVLPTLDVDLVDEVMIPVLPELINNLGHLAPAVRKGALDTLRVYLVCSQLKEQIVTRILEEGLTRPDALDNFQTNVTLGVILSTPSLLFPSSSSPRPSKQMLRQAIGALAMRLIQLAHQEASIRSLVKIHEILGDEEFNTYLNELDANAKRDYQVLCDVYKVKPSEKNSRKRSGKKTKRKKDVPNGVKKNNEENDVERRNNELNKKWDNDVYASEDKIEEKALINSPMPTARIVLETEIKFNEETAITMTILEEKDLDSEDEETDVENGEEFAKDEEIILEEKNVIEEAKNDDDDDDSKDAWIERRKTPRRVHFGGEVVKLRTPDSDDSELVHNEVPQTRIPLPISPTTKMPDIRPRRSMSNPSSPNVAKSRIRKSRSASNSPRREFYTHDASLSPKKSILSKSNPTVVVELVDDIKKIGAPNSRKIVEKKVDQLFGKEEDDRGWAFEVCENDVHNDLQDEKLESKNSTNAKNNREVMTKKRNSATINNEAMEISEIGVNAAEEDAKVEKVEILRGSEVVDATLESFRAVEVKEEIEVQKTPANAMEISQKDTREVEDKLGSSGEMKPSDSHRRSPRSPKKMGFESFPRKERNYILMELSSPVKTNPRKIGESEVIYDDQQLLGATVNSAEFSRGNSPMGPAADHLFIDPNGIKDCDTSLEDQNSRTHVESEKIEKKRELADDEMQEISKKKESFVDSPSPVPKFRESSWEELGLVDQDVLNDLHNKDDWRARVRGLERVASALRTSSALIAIESRLGSLLQAVLGGERSCRVAAAGMAVARVVVAGVSEEALKRRLPQVAWGLARQGGPNAAQLARVAMLRLRPALLLEQLLQPHCIKARNAKTRENALQLLIFSLVTFPSTEFKVENVANKVATMVADRRRRVRQAALDTLAVLAQIYEPEEVMQAGKIAAKGQQDGDAMIAAIRARLARKSLPMVSADGLVVYGLQISPTVQIATGPDVDWIVAGSGSVSPGTGRTRGQIIATTTRQGVQEKNAKNESMKNVSKSKGPNFVAVGVGLESKNEQHQPLAWQLVQHSAQGQSHRIKDKLWDPVNRDNNSSGKNLEVGKSRLTGSLRYYRSASDRLNDSFESEATPIFLLDDKDVIMKQRKTEENFHRRMDEIYAERTGIGPTAQDLAGNRLESRIPVPQSRDREINGRDSRIGTSYITRRRNQEENNLQNWSASSRGSEASRPRSIQRSNDRLQPEVSAQSYQRIRRDATPERLSPTRDTYRSIYQQRRGFADGNVYREVQTAPTTTSYDVSRRRQSLRDSEVANRMPQESRRTSTEAQTSTSNDSRSRRLMPNGPPEGYRLLKPSVTNGDKNTVVEEEHNEINKRHFSVQTNPYRIQNLSDRSAQFPARNSNGPSDTSSNESSNTSGEDRQETQEKVQNDRQRVMESFVVSEPEILHPSPLQSPMLEKSFDVITHETNPSRRNSIEYGISGNEVLSSNVVYSTDPENEEYETDKGSSTDDASVLPGVQSCQAKFVETSVREKVDDDEDDNDEDDDSLEVEEPENHQPSSRNVATSFVLNESNSSDGGLSKVSNDSPASNESGDIVDATSNSTKSPTRVDSVYALRSIDAVVYDNSRSSTDENDGPDSTAEFVREYSSDVSIENRSMSRVASPQAIKDTEYSVTEAFFQQSQEHRIPVEDETGVVTNTVSMLAATRPHSRDLSEYEEASFQPLDFRQPHEIIAIGATAVTKIAATSTRAVVERVNESPKKTSFTAFAEEPTIQLDIPGESTTITTNNHGKINRASSTGNESGAPTLPEVIGSQSGTSENNEAQKRATTSRVPRMKQKTRTNLARVAPMPVEKTPAKSKPIMQQCFTQLESNDWEVAAKGLKALSQIARQHPEQLDSCASGTLGRLLGRHVRNLRSQVSRAACLAAGDVFSSQARCIDQDLDDIAGPLLHRTADTNKFLRADSNEALDRMVEHLPPNKTIGVIVHRGATHQNAIVRAATARLLASIVDRLGPDWAMSLPRDVREKLIATGAKLLMDGNLDARNYAKRMIRKLARCEGFRKALTDSVPEATLRHIDKTLKSL